MYLGGHQGGNGNGVNVNTNFFISYSETSMIKVGGWNRQLSIKVHPATGKDANGLTQYAQDASQVISTSITEDNAIALSAKYDEYGGDKSVLEKKPFSFSIGIGSAENRKVLTVSYDGTDAFFELAMNVNVNGVALNTIKHKFNKKQVVEGYVPTTGEGTEVTIETELINFMKKINGVQNLVPMTAHSTKYNNALTSAYSANNNAQGGGNRGGTNYQAPSSNADGDMGFLPFN